MQGTRFGRYRVVDKLAEGGMGAVYTATHELMNLEVVVKILLPEMSADKSIIKRFFNEAQAAASIQHPGIVAVLDVGYADDGRAYIVMEKLPGENLQARLDRMHRLEPAHASALMRQLAGAVGAAHERGIVHRDLKPANVFVVPDPEVPGGERIKVLDFGLAKLLLARGSLATHTGSIFGTPAYMAPEQGMNAAAVDHRADLYAIGCMFYACVCGRPPFVTNNPMQMMLAHMNEAVPPPRSLQPALPPYHESLILNLLEKRPDDRMPSCAALIEALDHGAVLFGGSVSSAPGASSGLAPASAPFAAGSHAPAGSSPGSHPGQASPSHALGYAPTAPPPASHGHGNAPTTPHSAPYGHGNAPTAPPAPYGHGNAPTAPHSAPYGHGNAPTAPHSAPYAPAPPNPAAPTVPSLAGAQGSMSAGAGHVQTAPTGTPHRSRWPLVAGAAAVVTILGLAAALIYVTTRKPDTQVVAETPSAAPPPAQAQADEKTPAGSAAEVPAPAAVNAATRSGAAARPRPALAALPGNAQVVARIDVPRVMASPLYEKLLLPALSAQSEDENLGPMLRACGKDRIAAMKTITVATVGNNDKTAMVIEGLTRDALASCLRGMASAAGETVRVHHDGNFTEASNGSESFWFGWLGDTAFATRANARNKAMVAGMLDGKDGVDGNMRTMSLIESADRKAAIWLVMPKVDPDETGMAHDSMYMSIDVDSGLALTVGLRHADAGTAAAAAQAFQAQLEALRDTPQAAFRDAIRIQTRGKDVIVSVRLGKDAVEALMQGDSDGMNAEILEGLLDM
jgi:serine/threonine protein kinase